MREKCTRLRSTCRKCKIRFRGYTEPLVCECGEPRRCASYPVYGTTVCSRHGGGYPETRGTFAGSGIKKMGKHSKFQLVRLASSFKEAKEDPELLSNRDSAALIQMRLKQLIESIDETSDPQRWQRVLDLWDVFTRYYTPSVSDKHEYAAFKALESEMETAWDEYRAWEQLFRAADLKSKLSQAEIKRIKEMRKIITEEDAYKLVAKIMAVVTEELKDEPHKLTRIQHRFIRLLGEGDRELIGASGGHRVDERSGEMDRDEVLDTGTERPDDTGAVSESVLEGSVKEG